MGISFTAAVRRIGDRSVILLPDSASDALPSRGQVAVTGSIEGQDVSTVVEPDGRHGHWIPVDEQLLPDLDDDDPQVHVELTPSKQWPEPTVPSDLGAALTGAEDARSLWQDITAMARWEWVRWINATRNPDTRSRRVEVTISKLQAGKRRPCCFDLSSCTDPELSKSGKLVVTP